MDRSISTIKRWRGALLAGSLLVLAADACGGESGDANAVLPFADVQATEFVFEADPTNADRGVFHVTTTEPMICAIVWGETEAFGNFNNSLAMSGTGIVEHDVYLPGAVPGRTYHFQVQGSTADGRLYRSPSDTFTIPELPPGEPPPTSVDTSRNLARNGTVADVSSEFNDAFAGVNAIDGSGTTEWSSAGDGDDAFITIDLGSPQAITGVEFVTRSMLDGTAITETFTVTIDDGDRFGPFPAGTAADRDVATIDAAGQLVRFDVETSTGGNVGAVEVGIYGP